MPRAIPKSGISSFWSGATTNISSSHSGLIESATLDNNSFPPTLISGLGLLSPNLLDWPPARIMPVRMF